MRHAFTPGFLFASQMCLLWTLWSDFKGGSLILWFVMLVYHCMLIKGVKKKNYCFQKCNTFWSEFQMNALHDLCCCMLIWVKPEKFERNRNRNYAEDAILMRIFQWNMVLWSVVNHHLKARETPNVCGMRKIMHIVPGLFLEAIPLRPETNNEAVIHWQATQKRIRNRAVMKMMNTFCDYWACQ